MAGADVHVPGEGTPRRLLAIADTDSYLKWSAETLVTLPSDWQRSQVVVENPVMPSEGQIRAASSLPVQVLDRAGIARRLRVEKPDVVLLACTGPVVAVLAAARELRGRDRPVLVTGLPGISVPATPRAVELRRSCDLLIVHSHREIAEFRALGAEPAPHLIFGLASLPFLRSPVPDDEDAELRRTDLIFAAQAKVPMSREHREQILLALAEAGSAVVKVRADKDEQQTHREDWPYPKLAADLVAQERLATGRLRFRGGSMRDVLATARALTTVSSTAALEAMAADVPVLIISDFGVSEEMINIVSRGPAASATWPIWRRSMAACRRRLVGGQLLPPGARERRLDVAPIPRPERATARYLAVLATRSPLAAVRRRVRLLARPARVRRLRAVARMASRRHRRPSTRSHSSRTAP